MLFFISIKNEILFFFVLLQKIEQNYVFKIFSRKFILSIK